MPKIILVTGSRKGIGRYIAEHLLESGYTVIGVSRSKSDLEDINYSHYTADVSDEKSVLDIMLDVSKKYGKLDVLINNAGAASMNHLILTPAETADKLYNVNFKGTFLFTRECSKLMMRDKSGIIINFSSIAAKVSIEGEALYASMKSAIDTFTEITAKELSHYGITCNAIAPGIVDTSLTRSVPKEKLQKLIDMTTAKRYTQMSDITNLIDFLIKPESQMVTGQILYLGG